MSAPRILIIDDDEVLLVTAEAVLRGAGYEVATHQGPFGATSEFIRYAPNLVLLDVNMPGLSGPALADLIQRKGWAEGTRILFYSSSEEEYLESLVKKTAVDGYVRKGDHDELRRKVALVLQS